MSNSIRIRCDINNLKIVRDFVTDYLSRYNLSENVLNQIILAVDEITANLIIHANEKDKSKFIELSIKPLADHILLFEFKDHGKFFDLEINEEPDIPTFIKIGKKGGIGLALVKRIMNKVEFLKEGETNITSLYKHIQ
jgi:serine/threonine-protein kinase RsbW